MNLKLSTITFTFLCFLDGLQQIHGILKYYIFDQFTSWSTHNKERDCKNKIKQIMLDCLRFKRI